MRLLKIVLFAALLLSAFPLHAEDSQPKTEVDTVAWSPDGSKIAVGGFSYSGNVTTPFLTVRNPASLTVILDLSSVPGGQTLQIYWVSWSPDGKYLASASSDGSIAVWNINDANYAAGALISKFGNYAHGVNNVAWSPDGKWIAALDTGDQILSIWSTPGNSFQLAGTQNPIDPGMNLAWSPSGNYLAIDGNRGIVVYTISSTGSFVAGSEFAIKSIPTSAGPSGFAWNATGTQLAYSDPAADAIRIYDVSTKALIRNIEVFSYPSDLAWSPDGTKLAYGATGNTVRVMDVNTGAELVSYPTGKVGAAEQIAWAPDSTKLAFPLAGELPAIVDTAHLEDTPAAQTLQTPLTEVQAVAWSPDGSNIAVGGFRYSGNVTTPFLTVRNPATLTVILDLSSVPGGQTLQIYWVSWSPDGKYLASASSDGSIAVWNIHDADYTAGALIRKFGNYVRGVNNVAWSPDGKWIAALDTGDELLSIWSTAGNKFQLTGTQKLIDPGMNLGWYPNSKHLAIDSSRGIVRYTISSTGNFLTGSDSAIKFTPNSPRPSGFAWNAAGTQLAYSDPYADAIHVYDEITQTFIRDIEVFSHPVNMVWSPDRTKFAYGAAINTVRVMDANTGAELVSYPTGKVGAAEQIAWAPDSTKLAFPLAGELPAIVDITHLDVYPDATAAP